MQEDLLVWNYRRCKKIY